MRPRSEVDTLGSPPSRQTEPPKGTRRPPPDHLPRTEEEPEGRERRGWRSVAGRIPVDGRLITQG